jgi:hypothetical protein
MRTTAGALNDLSVALAELVALDVAALSDVEVLDALRVLHPLLCQAEALQSRLIGAAHGRGAAALDGAVSTVSWLRCRLRLGDAPAQVRVAKALSGLPHVTEAYGRGEMSFAHAAAITEVASDIQPELLAGGADKLLAEQAAALGPAATRRAALRIRDHFDPEAAERRTRRVFADRWLAVDRTIHGCVAIQGVLDPEGGELVLSTLGALTPPAIPGDCRSAGARRADALVQMCRLAGAATPEAGGVKPHVSVTIDWQTLRDGLTATPATLGGRLGSGIGIHPATARRLACDATLIPAVLGSVGEPLDIGRATRLVPAGMRRALVLRDGGCRFPGCDRPPQWTDAHHLHPWAHGGATRLPNLLLLCRHHHTTVHEGGWRLDYDTKTNTVTAYRPSGQRLDLTGQPQGPAP